MAWHLIVVANEYGYVDALILETKGAGDVDVDDVMCHTQIH